MAGQTSRKKPKKVNIKPKKENRQPLAEKTSSPPPVWNPFELVDNMDQWFWEDPWTPIWWTRRQMTPWNKRTTEPDTKITPLDVVDMGTSFKIITEVPGVTKKDLDVNVTPNQISICGELTSEIKDEEHGYLRRERSYSSLCRSTALPEEVDPEKAEATLKDGILEIILPKKTPTKSRSIPIK